MGQVKVCMKGLLRSTLFLFLVIILSFWAVKPLFHTGFFPMHDDTQVARVYEMAQALSFGQFPVRWVGDLGYGFGYPLFNLYAPLPYYIGSIFNLLGFDALIATKIMFLTGIIFSGITMFFLLRFLFDDVSALMGSLLYVYAPYHAVEIYVRGAVGEFYALAFLPLVLLGLLKIIKNSKENIGLKQGTIIGSLGIAGVFLSHNIYGMITGYFLIFGLLIYLIYVILTHKKLSVICHLLSVICLGLGLSVFFILPAIFEKNFTRVNELTIAGSNFHDHFVYLDQLWSSPWGFAGSAPGRLDGMSFMVGKIHLILGLLALLTLIILYKKNRLNRSHLSFVTGHLLLFTISIFLMLDVSKPIWEILPGFSFIQYPWRFLVIAIYSLSVIIPIILIPFQQKTKIIICAGIIILTIWFSSKYFYPNEYLSSTAEDYTNNQTLRFRISKISDEYLPDNFLIPKTIQEVGGRAINDSPYLKINEFADTPVKKIYNVSVSNSYTAETNITYFPGWQAKIDGENSLLDSRNGRITFFLPEGTHLVEFNFKDTPIRTLSNAISIFTLFLVVYIIIYKRKV